MLKEAKQNPKGIIFCAKRQNNNCACWMASKGTSRIRIYSICTPVAHGFAPVRFSEGRAPSKLAFLSHSYRAPKEGTRTVFLFPESLFNTRFVSRPPALNTCSGGGVSPGLLDLGLVLAASPLSPVGLSIISSLSGCLDPQNRPWGSGPEKEALEFTSTLPSTLNLTGGVLEVNVPITGDLLVGSQTRGCFQGSLP